MAARAAKFRQLGARGGGEEVRGERKGGGERGGDEKEREGGK